MTPEQVSQYNEVGYTTVPGFFALSEVAALKREVDRWVVQGLPRDVSIPAAKKNLQLIPLWPHSRLFRALPFHPKVQAAVSALLEDPVVKILDQMFYKPARHGLGTNWHTTTPTSRSRNRCAAAPCGSPSTMQRGKTAR